MSAARETEQPSRADDVPEDVWELMDWKRCIFQLYAEIRATADARAGWERWKKTRHELFTSHPQSPIPPSERGRRAPVYFDYEPALRVAARVRDAAPRRFEIPTSGGHSYAFSRVAIASFELGGRESSLEVYWLEGYGGGVFLPFRDATSGAETYGAGRYLLDTVKGADLGMDGDRLLLDFNFAYNPSCVYDPRWVCPLAPPPNRLDARVAAGEGIPEDGAPDSIRKHRFAA